MIDNSSPLCYVINSAMDFRAHAPTQAQPDTRHSENKMKVKVVSDGTPGRTRVYGPTGLDITSELPISAIRWTCDVGEGASVDLVIHSTAGEVEGEANVYVRHPITKKLERVEQIKFANGSSWDFTAPAWMFTGAEPVVDDMDYAQASRIAAAVDAQVSATVVEQLKRQMRQGGSLNRP